MHPFDGFWGGLPPFLDHSFALAICPKERLLVTHVVKNNVLQEVN